MRADLEPLDAALHPLRVIGSRVKGAGNGLFNAGKTSIKPGDPIAAYRGRWYRIGEAYRGSNAYVMETDNFRCFATSCTTNYAAMSNEPPPGTQANAFFMHWYHPYETKPRAQRNELRLRSDEMVVLTAATEIAPNAEIFAHYGSRYTRNYDVGMPAYFRKQDIQDHQLPSRVATRMQKHFPKDCYPPGMQ